MPFRVSKHRTATHAETRPSKLFALMVTANFTVTTVIGGSQAIHILAQRTGRQSEELNQPR